MAERRTTRNQDGSNRTSRSQNDSRRSSRGRLSGRQAIARVRADLPELIGHRVDSVLGLEPNDNDGWTVTVQVVELERIPRSTDVLGSYAVTLDQDGELAAVRRDRRYSRNQVDGE
jgi:hypothetical protein